VNIKLTRPKDPLISVARTHRPFSKVRQPTPSVKEATVVALQQLPMDQLASKVNEKPKIKRMMDQDKLDHTLAANSMMTT